MSTKHTPTPWAFGRVSYQVYQPETGKHIATFHVADAVGGGPWEDESLGNMEYAVACANERDTLIAQRDALAKALQYLANSASRYREMDDDVAEARAALASVKVEV